MDVDILFLDIACVKPYKWDTLELESIGGTEASTIRLAEGFGSMGHKVAVVQKQEIYAESSPNKVFYAPWRWLDAMKPKNVIHLRACTNIQRFPEARNFIWMHDACGPDLNNISGWAKFFDPTKVKCISVSDWHTKNILECNPSLDVTRIYSPVDEVCYDYKRGHIDRNQLVWMSSPHKGLEDAIRVFKDIRETLPELRLVVFNPGYFNINGIHAKNVISVPQCKRDAMRSIVSKSLCLFYPTHFEETFGLVAAEANALGTPVATYKIAALSESCSNEFASDEASLCEMIYKWRENRPTVIGQEVFRFRAVYNDWAKLLNLN